MLLMLHDIQGIYCARSANMECMLRAWLQHIIILHVVPFILWLPELQAMHGITTIELE